MIVVTGYAANGRPVTRMEIPERWLTPEWLAWMESRIAREEPTAPSLKLLG